MSNMPQKAKRTSICKNMHHKIADLNLCNMKQICFQLAFFYGRAKQICKC